MKVFKNLTIKDSENDKSMLISFLNYLKGHASNGWKYRDDLTSDYAKNVFKEVEEVSCFESPLLYENRVLVWLIILSAEVKVANIVPIKTGKLGVDLYNLFLDSFRDNLILPAAKAVGVDIITTSAYQDLSQIIGEETFQKLDLWERLCNKDSGNLHQLDFERWAAFVVTAYHFNSKLTTKILEQWLIEERDWSDGDIIEKLVHDFEYGLDLLKYYAGDH